MKLSTILPTALAALALASPATKERGARRDPKSLVDIILHKLNFPSIPLEVVTDFQQCMSAHKTFQTDYTKADDGVFSITNVDHTCCEKAKGIWSQIPDGQYGHADFIEPCEGATVTGIPKQYMGVVRGFFDSI